MLTGEEEFLSMRHLTPRITQKIINAFKSDYLSAHKTCTKCRTRIESPVQLCVQACTGRGAPNIVGQEIMRPVINLDAVAKRNMLYIHGIEPRIIDFPSRILTELPRLVLFPSCLFFI
jgi:hypothetical protein